MLRIAGIVALVAVIGFSMTACGDGGGGSDPKTLVITMPASIASYGHYGFEVGVFPVGTTPTQAQAYTGLVADADYETPGVTSTGTDPVTITIPLYKASHYNARWTGSGTYDIYANLYGGGDRYYKKGSVDISSATTSFSISSADEVHP